jgi:hypothetical protein
MITQRSVIGAQAKFFKSGAAITVPGAAVASRTAKPGAADPLWIDCGISDWNIQNTSETKNFMAPLPGARALYDVITISKGAKLKGKIMELSNLVYQMLLSSASLPASPTAMGQFNPLAGDPVVRGWLKLQQYDQFNTLILTMDVFVAMKIPGDVAFGGAEVDVDVEAEVLWSTLNTATGA